MELTELWSIKHYILHFLIVYIWESDVINNDIVNQNEMEN